MDQDGQSHEGKKKYYCYTYLGIAKSYQDQEKSCPDTGAVLIENGIATRGQEGGPVLQDGKLVGLVCGNDTENNEHNLVVSLITQELVEWIESSYFQ